jgi:hypothetical protein
MVEDLERLPEPAAVVAGKRCTVCGGKAPDSVKGFWRPADRAPLTVLVNSLEAEADFHPLGRFFMRVHLQELLETRLRLTRRGADR